MFQMMYLEFASGKRLTGHSLVELGGSMSEGLLPSVIVLLK